MSSLVYICIIHYILGKKHKKSNNNKIHKCVTVTSIYLHTNKSQVIKDRESRESRLSTQIVVIIKYYHVCIIFIFSIFHSFSFLSLVKACKVRVMCSKYRYIIHISVVRSFLLIVHVVFEKSAVRVVFIIVNSYKWFLQFSNLQLSAQETKSSHQNIKNQQSTSGQCCLST